MLISLYKCTFILVLVVEDWLCDDAELEKRWRSEGRKLETRGREGGWEEEIAEEERREKTIEEEERG